MPKLPTAYENEKYWSTLHKTLSGQLAAVGYHTLGEGFNLVTYRIRLNALKRLLRTVACGHSPRDLLENAVGVGAYSTVWAGLGISRWVGTDISYEAVQLMRIRSPHGTFIHVDLASSEYISKVQGSFELVTAIDILYHFLDDVAFEQALENIAAKVKPSGFLIVSDVFAPNRSQTAAHVVRRPLAHYEAVLLKHGLKIVGREPVFGFLGDPLRERGVTSKLLFCCWRLLQKTIRSTPALLRNPVGYGLAFLLWPLDAI